MGVTIHLAKRIKDSAPLKVPGSGLEEGRENVNLYGLMVREDFLAEADWNWI